MAENVTFKLLKPLAQVVQDAGVNARTMMFAAVTWHRLYNDFVPANTLNLANNVAYTSTAKKGTIRHVVSYASYPYNGKGMNFRRDRHPLASAQWDKAAEAAGKKQALVRDVQAFVKRG